MAMIDIGTDDTKPTGRAAPDPLLANPVMSSGLTGQIERPGDHTPRWLIPLLTVAGLGFITALVLVTP